MRQLVCAAAILVALPALAWDPPFAPSPDRVFVPLNEDGTARTVSRLPVVPVPLAREVDVATLRALLEDAGKEGRRSVFVGGPAWAFDGSGMRALPGLYLLDNGAIVEVGP